MFTNYNYLTVPNPGFPNFPFPPPFPTNYPPNFPIDQNFQNPPPVLMNNFPNTTVNLNVTSEMRKKDAEFINNFLDERESTNDEIVKSKTNTSKISDINIALGIIFKLNQSLKSICAELRHKNLSDSEWHEKVKIAEMLKGQVDSLLLKFKDKEFMKEMKHKLEKRKKKRLREKRKRETRRQQIREQRARLHLKIDNWIKKKQDSIEKEKQEERLRKDADIVLGDVRGKRTDAKKCLSLLRELANLRNVKVKIARARGENLSVAADEAFNNIIVKLIEQWTALDREYSMEEQGLKLMIKTDNEKKEETEKKHAFNNWEKVLFGQGLPNNAFLQNSLSNFVTIRTMWDKFCNINGEPIPIGWVVPAPPSSASWQRLLKK